MAESAIQLESAKRPRWHRRAFGWTVVGIALLAVAGTAWRWRSEVSERREMLYWQGQCMNYSPPADEIVFDQVPGAKSGLLDGRPGYFPGENDLYKGPTFTAVAGSGDCAYQFVFHTLGLVSRPTSKWASPIVFAHERSAPSGRKYLVILHGIDREVGGDTTSHLGQFVVDQDLTQPASLGGSTPPVGRTDYPFTVPLLTGNAANRLRIFAGQADPKDPTHFTIRFEIDGRAGVVDGFVSDRIVSNNPSAPGGYVAHVKLTERRAD